jgi:hypothetical protein
MACVKWQYAIDFNIIMFFAVWRTEKNGSSESTKVMQ